jgi:hypothetical protein
MKAPIPPDDLLASFEAEAIASVVPDDLLASFEAEAIASVVVDFVVDFVVDPLVDGRSIEALSVLAVELYTRRALHDTMEQLEALYIENIFTTTKPTAGRTILNDQKMLRERWAHYWYWYR